MQKNLSPYRLIYPITIFLIIVTGFAQMPVFKRYYIADIPGLSWLAEFFITHSLHYIAGIVLTCFYFNGAANVVISKKTIKTISLFVIVKSCIVTVLISTGLLMMAKNFSGIYFRHDLIIVLNLTHLVMCVLLIVVSVAGLFNKTVWPNFGVRRKM